MRILTFILAALLAVPVYAQVTVLKWNDTNDEIVDDLKFGVGRTLTIVAGADLDIESPGVVSSLLDDAFGDTEGSILYRGSVLWEAMEPGTAGLLLATGGAGESPYWSSGVSIGDGSSFTITGDAFLDPGASFWFQEGSDIILFPEHASTILDAIGETRGILLYRGASGWAARPPAAAGLVLMSNGPGADPTYEYRGSMDSNKVLTLTRAVNVFPDVASAGLILDQDDDADATFTRIKSPSLQLVTTAWDTDNATARQLDWHVWAQSLNGNNTTSQFFITHAPFGGAAQNYLTIQGENVVTGTTALSQFRGGVSVNAENTGFPKMQYWETDTTTLPAFVVEDENTNWASASGLRFNTSTDTFEFVVDGNVVTSIDASGLDAETGGILEADGSLLIGVDWDEEDNPIHPGLIPTGLRLGVSHSALSGDPPIVASSALEFRSSMWDTTINNNREIHWKWLLTGRDDQMADPWSEFVLYHTTTGGGTGAGGYVAAKFVSPSYNSGGERGVIFAGTVIANSDSDSQPSLTYWDEDNSLPAITFDREGLAWTDVSGLRFDQDTNTFEFIVDGSIVTSIDSSGIDGVSTGGDGGIAVNTADNRYAWDMTGNVTLLADSSENLGKRWLFFDPNGSNRTVTLAATGDNVVLVHTGTANTITFTDGDTLSVVMQPGQIASAMDSGAGWIISAESPVPVTMTLVAPHNTQEVTDAAMWFPVESSWAPNGIYLVSATIKTGASSTYAINVEEWTSPTDGAPTTLVPLTTSAGTEASGTISDASVAAGSMVMLDLPTTTLDSWVTVQLVYVLQP